MTERFRARLTEEAQRSKQYKSAHDYGLAEYGISEEEVYATIPQIFEAYGFERYPEQAPAPNGGIDAGIGAARNQERRSASAALPAHEGAGSEPEAAPA